jgi:hypothetical protein
MRFATVLALCLHLAREWHRSGCAAPPPSQDEVIARVEYGELDRREVRITNIGMVLAITDHEARALGLRVTEPSASAWSATATDDVSLEVEAPPESQPPAAAIEPDIAADRRSARRKHAILTEEIVRDLRQRYASGESLRAAAGELGVRYNTLLNAATGRTWRHVA